MYDATSTNIHFKKYMIEYNLYIIIYMAIEH